ncbi:protein FAM169B [Scomber scombrus]|uniref:Protein FAM169B n=2 Tax=Scomber scombrus TaxID=13677 RepID=A0AAV1PEX8_SCOSC|nr:protein FAM169B isoform X2 [Scomber scombrus]XP_062277308.1 protein FAM169B isoform X2 [Scomber scombrus]XP_062277309.1 protein FAM169B isoform X2 [Scomber scombrus]
MYPIDLPAVDDSDLRSSSEQYLSSLESRRHDDEWFQSSQNSKVAITPNNVRWLQVFEDDQSEFSVLVLHPPDHLTQVVALHLHGKWWCVDDVLRTSSKSRSGLVSVQTIMERVIVFLLSQVVERPLQEELLFTLHPRTESCKLLWRDGQAVGFYTIKHKGSLCDSWSSQCYLLPVLDTVLVRRSWRKRGFGLQMLDDFCSSFSREEVLGVSAPLSPSMVAVCRRFLQLHKQHGERLYEVEAPGGWTQRRNIWLNMQLGRYSSGINEESNPTTLKNEGDDSSEKTSKLDLASPNTCNVTIPLIIGSSEQQIKPCDPSQGGRSQSSKTSGTGCSPATHAHDLDSGPPTRPLKSLNTKQALKSKPPLSTDPCREKPEAEETHRGAKRVRRK